MTRKRRTPGVLVPAANARSMVQVKIGNRVYDAVYQANCHTCTHPARMDIEAQIIRGFSYRKIAAQFSGVEFDIGNGEVETMPEVGFMSIRNHYVSGHMPVEGEALRTLAERRAQKIGASIEDSNERLVDQYVLAEAIVHETWDDLVTGRLSPDLKDGLAAAKFLQDIDDRQAASFDAEAWSQAMTIYFETAMAMMPPEMWNRFTEQLRSNPILAALARKLSPQSEDDEEVVDGEVV